MESRYRNVILEEHRAKLLELTQNWMAQYQIPSQGEEVSFTVEIRYGCDPQLVVTVKWKEQGRPLTEEEWSQALLATKAPKQRALLESLRDSPNRQRSARELREAGFTYGYLHSPVNRTLKLAGLPFTLMKLPGQRGRRGASWECPISLVALPKS